MRRLDPLVAELDGGRAVAPDRLGLGLGELEEFGPIVGGIPGGALVAGRSDLSVDAAVDGTHYGTEKPPPVAMAEWFRRQGLPAEFLAVGPK